MSSDEQIVGPHPQDNTENVLESLIVERNEDGLCQDGFPGLESGVRGLAVRDHYSENCGSACQQLKDKIRALITSSEVSSADEVAGVSRSSLPTSNVEGTK